MAWRQPQKSKSFLGVLRDVVKALRDQADEQDRQNEKRIRQMAESMGIKPKGGG